MYKSRFLALGVAFVAFLTAINAGSFTPRVQAAALTSSNPHAVAVANAAAQNPAPAAQVPDWTLHGFSTIIASQQIAPGQAADIQAGPYTLQVPAGAFSETVTLQVYTGSPSNFTSDAPQGETPILAFALGAMDAQGQLVAKFNKPVTLTATDPAILAGSKYYNVDQSGTLTPNSTGMKVAQGVLMHPIAADSVGWVITSPTAALNSASSQVPDWTLHGFPTIIASQKITPGQEAFVNAGPYTIQVPANAFTSPVTLQVYAGSPSHFMSNSLQGETPVLAFALGAMDSQGQLMAKFNAAVGLTARDPAIVKGSMYYNVDSSGTLTKNTKGLVVEPGELIHPIVADAVGWVITSPTSALTSSSSKVPDWTQHGFPNIIASQVIIPGDNTSVQAGPYTLEIPAETFSEPVTLQVYTGSASNFTSKAPKGQQPVLAFALGAMDSAGQLVAKFNNPIQLSAVDPAIVHGSQYYNISADGTYAPNPKGMKVSNGSLSHPIAADAVGWVISSPASVNAPSASNSTSTSQAATVKVANNPQLGNILVDNQGMTLYVFKNDKPNQSNCTGSCAQLWPPLTIAKGTTPASGMGITGSLGVIQRSDGTYQVTYNQQPLYRYSGDSQPGQTNGNGLYHLWSVVKVSASNSASGSGTSNSSGGSNSSGASNNSGSSSNSGGSSSSGGSSGSSGYGGY